jgi:ABC-2 type transport system permease protein
MVTTAQQFRILARYNARTIFSRLLELISASRLMTATLALFLSGYLVIGYVIFAHGLVFIQRLPAVGTILGERILYMIFFFVFLMLILSNAVVQFGSLFRSKETDWLLTLPIDANVIFAWKTLESLIISSWGFMFICAPLLAAYGTLHEVSWTFYAKAFVLMIPFVAIPANLAAWLILFLVRYARRAWWPVIVALLVAGAAWYFYEHFIAEKQLKDMESNIVFALNQALNHTRISIHPLIPSTWWTEALLDTVKDLTMTARFNALLLGSNALMASLLTFSIAGAAFTRVKNVGTGKQAQSVSRRLHKARRKRISAPRTAPRFGLFSRSSRALVVKDLRGFTRDPAQWIQVVVVFGLLLIYVLNIRNMGYDLDTAFWTNVLTFLNIAVCSLALSTLTTRFVFPQFSLDGHRLWVIGLAPFPMTKVLYQKLFLNVALTGSATVLLMILSGFMLKLPGPHIVFFVTMIATLSFGLNAIAVSFGALFPNLKETNPAKIVSGFGGTFCLITSFLYIVVFLSSLIFVCISSGLADLNPASIAAVETDPDALPPATPVAIPWLLAESGALAITAFFSGLPLFFASKRVKTLELLGNL